MPFSQICTSKILANWLVDEENSSRVDKNSFSCFLIMTLNSWRYPIHTTYVVPHEHSTMPTCRRIQRKASTSRWRCRAFFVWVFCGDAKRIEGMEAPKWKCILDGIQTTVSCSRSIVISEFVARHFVWETKMHSRIACVMESIYFCRWSQCLISEDTPGAILRIFSDLATTQGNDLAQECRWCYESRC